MKEIQENLRKGRFLVLGRAGMDLYPDPAGTKTEYAEKMVAHLGGSSANIAVALVRHGCAASIVTSVSDDAIGRFSVNKLKDFGVCTKYVSSVGGEKRTSLAIVESTIEDHQSVIYRNGAADFMMSKSDVESIDLKNYDAVVFTGTMLAAQESRDATAWVLKQADRFGLVKIFDVDFRPYSWESSQQAGEVYTHFAHRSDIVVGNDDEFAVMAGSKSAGQRLAKKLGCRPRSIVIYKKGSHGAVSFSLDQEIHTGVFSVKALKPVGAGDGFMGGFLQSLVNGYDLEGSVVRGSACAAIVVSRVGCAAAMPSTIELNHFLQQHNTAA